MAGRQAGREPGMEQAGSYLLKQLSAVHCSFPCFHVFSSLLAPPPPAPKSYFVLLRRSRRLLRILPPFPYPPASFPLGLSFSHWASQSAWYLCLFMYWKGMWGVPCDFQQYAVLEMFTRNCASLELMNIMWYKHVCMLKYDLILL